MVKLLVVCLGNINRSPLAAAVLSAQKKFEVQSAAFLPHHGKRAAKKLRDWAENTEWSVEGHRSQQITPELVEWADVVLLMDNGNRRRFLALFGQDMFDKKVKMLGESVGLDRIPDPGFVARSDPRLPQIYETVVQASLAFSKGYKK